MVKLPQKLMEKGYTLDGRRIEKKHYGRYTPSLHQSVFVELNFLFGYGYGLWNVVFEL